MTRKVGVSLVSACAAWLLCMGCAFGGSEGAAQGAVSYINGLQNSEDILQIGSTRWLVASGLVRWKPDPTSHGHIYLVNRLDASHEVWFPSDQAVFKQDQHLFPACPGPLNPAKFSAHGLSLRLIAAGRFRMYMTGHGEREAVEAFEIDARGAKPTLTWVGCVLLPQKMWGNSVAILKDGGFLVTKSKDSTNPDAFKHLVEARITGEVFEWHPGGTVTAVPGTQMSCPNGISLSTDDRWMYVTAMGTREVKRFDRKTPSAAPKTVRIPVYPDNIHWGDDGKLYTIGRNAQPGPNCPRLNCGTGWSIIRVDPGTLATHRMLGVDQTAPMQAPSGAITAGDRFWIASFDGDQIGYAPKPQ